jgi:predicted nucleic acid-binding Zn ribbon protein
MTRRGHDGEKRISELLEAALRGLEVRREVREVQLREAFAAVVGPHAAQLCNAVSLERGVLCVATAHTALAHQLQLDSPALIAALNARIGTDAVRRLRFVPRG